jgi:hypothetical protein
VTIGQYFAGTVAIAVQRAGTSSGVTGPGASTGGIAGSGGTGVRRPTVEVGHG